MADGKIDVDDPKNEPRIVALRGMVQDEIDRLERSYQSAEHRDDEEELTYLSRLYLVLCKVNYRF